MELELRSEEVQGSHEMGGRALGGGVSRGQAVGPLALILSPKILINSKNNFRGVSGLLELCRIGLYYLLLYQPRIPAAGILPLHVNLVK